MSDDPEAPKDAERLAREGIEVAAPEFAIVSPEPVRTTTKDNLEEGRTSIKNRTALMILELASHTLILGLALGSLWLIHLILEALLGRDARFFNSVPVSWIIDVADLLVIGKFLWSIIRDFRRG